MTRYMGQKLADMVKMHSREALYALDDPLEAAVFSVLIELLKETDHKAVKKRDDPNIEPSA
jgi:hypothetical protein